MWPRLTGNKLYFVSTCIGVFALAISLIGLEKPERSDSSHETHVYKPRHNSVYAPVGTTIEVRCNSFPDVA